MSNIYFPDEEITFNDLYFVCYMIERTARHLHQRNNYVVKKLGKAALERQLSIAGTLHCLNPEQVVADWKEEYALESGNFDVTSINPRFTDKIPSETQMGKVYQRLISDTLQPGEDYVDGIIRVYNDDICEVIDNYNCSAFYEPSYVIARAYQNGGF